MRTRIKRVRKLHAKYWGGGGLDLEEGLELKASVLELCELCEELISGNIGSLPCK